MPNKNHTDFAKMRHKTMVRIILAWHRLRLQKL